MTKTIRQRKGHSSDTLLLRDVVNVRQLVTRVLSFEKRARISKHSQVAFGEMQLTSIAFAGFAGVAPEVFVYLCLYIESFIDKGLPLRLQWEDKDGRPTPVAIEAIVGFELREYLLASAAKRGVEIQEQGTEIFDTVRVGNSLSHIPLGRISRNSFVANEPLFEAYPSLIASDVQTAAIEKLTVGGYLTRSQLAVFRVSLFLELAWNAVLHAAEEPGRGWCLFAGTAHNARNSSKAAFVWALGDGGRGIVAALSLIPTSKAPETRLGRHRRALSPAIATLQRLGARDATSRSSRPAPGLEDGNRGYRHIADIARSHGSLTVMSNGAIVTLAKVVERDGAPQWKEVRDFGMAETPGTLVWGTLDRVTTEEYYKETGATESEWPRDATYLCLVTAGLPDTLDLSNVRERIGSKAIPGKRLVVDFGFVDATVEQILVVLNAALHDHITSPLVIVNLAVTEPKLLSTIESRLAEQGLCPPIPILCLARGRYFRAISGHRAKDEFPLFDPWPTHNGLRDDSGINPMLTLLIRVNSEYLRVGLQQKAGDGVAGFFRSNVQLFSGKTVGGYFALSGNVANNASARRRWATSIARAIDELVRNARPRGRVTLLSFSEPMEEVAAETAQIVREWLDADSIVVRSYEPPSRAELAEKLNGTKYVILITDAVLTGSQLHAFAEVVARLDASIIGAVTAVALVDEIGGFQFPLLALGFFKVPEAGAGPALVLDPISLIPRRPLTERVALVARSQRSLEVLRDAQATVCGHFDVSGRHAMYYVNTRELLASGQRRALRSLLAERLEIVGPSIRGEGEAIGKASHFTPTVVVRPIGVPGIVSQSGKENIDEHQEALDSLTGLIIECRPSWREALTAPHVALRRTYEGGIVRASLPELLKKRIGGADILFIDDGVSSGQTLRGLLEQLRAWNASRVVVIGLLARMRIDDVLWFEGIRELHGGSAEQNVSVRFLFPLVAPIPFFRADECPFELAASSIKPYAERSDDVAESARAILSELLPTKLIAEANAGGAFNSSYAMYLRGSLELATEDALLSTRLSRELSDGPLGTRLAMLSVVGIEPRLLLRPRLKSWLAKSALTTALEVIVSPEMAAESRRDALTLVRTAFPGRYSDAMLALEAAGDCVGGLVDRCAFQAFSLDDSTKSDTAFLLAVDRLRLDIRTHVRKSPPVPEKAEQLRRANATLERILWTVDRLPAMPTPESLTDALRDVLIALRENDTLHDLPSVIQAIALAASTLGNTTSEDVDWLRELWEEWPDIIKRELLPLLEQLAPYLETYIANVWREPTSAALELSILQDYSGPTADELLPLVEIATTVLADVTNIALLLDISIVPNRNAVHSYNLRQAIAAAERLHLLVFSWDSALRRACRSLTSLQLDMALEALEASLKRIGRNVRVVRSEIAIDATLRSRVLLVDPLQWVAIMRALVGNVAAYAVRERTEEFVIVLQVRRRDDTAIIELGDSGVRASTDSPVHDASSHSRRLDAYLNCLGGWMNTKYAIDDEDVIDGVRVLFKQAVCVAFAPDQLRRLCAR